MEKTLYPGSVWGQVDIPASKSQTIHALLLALFSRGVSTITNPLLCSDTQACLDFCTKLGARISYSDNTMVIDSSSLSPKDGLEIDCKNSGTTLFFATALSCALGVDIRFTGDDTLKRRPVRSLLSSLHDLGANVDPTIEYAPYNICGPLLGGHTSIRCMTGQYLTALLLAAPLAKEDITIDVYLLKERTAVRTTEIWLEKEGIDFFRDHDMNHYTIRGNQSYRSLETDINGDFSLAAFFFCAAAITSSTITVTHLDAKSSQADREILKILSDMGCSVRSEGHTVTLTGPSRLKAVDIDMSGIPDLLPALAVTACFASGPVRLNNVTHSVAKGAKERSSTIANDINAIGGQAQVLSDSLVIYPVNSLDGASSVDSYGDPRIVMAMALASLRSARGLTIHDCDCVNELYPDFFDRFSNVIISSNRI
ncbi:MAG: 3-phosphoshikimate 1-carboxyvinyltransferase [Spirochaetales bacterium]|nr:3-phosphoshikimate 1-carboxyvinyltransferase [Spirochaetales bacterium]